MDKLKLKIGQTWKIGFGNPFSDSLCAEILDIKTGSTGVTYIQYIDYFTRFDKFLISWMDKKSTREDDFRNIFDVLVSEKK
jgi:hypothetical protein